MMLIVGGTASNNLEEKIAPLVGAEFFKVESKLFPDGESYIRFPRSVEGEHTVIIQSTYPYQDKRILELLLLVDSARDMRAKEITVVVPYLAYARQDKAFDKEQREAISIRTILRCLKRAGIDSMITVDIHSPSALSRYSEFRTENIEAASLIGKYFKEAHNLGNVLVVAPDLKASDRASSVAEILNTKLVAVEKHRDPKSGKVEFDFSNLDLAMRSNQYDSTLIVDDMIFAGSTVIPLVERLTSKKAGDIFVACVHGGFIEDSLAKLEKAGAKEVISTDTIPSIASRISIAPAIAESLRKHDAGTTVSL